jgi:hypothetical protein
MKPLRLAFAALILASPLFAQNESGVSLTIRFADGTSRFHVGEIIPLELSFHASIPGMYDMEMRNYDRSGRTSRGFTLRRQAVTRSNATIPPGHLWAVAWEEHVNSLASLRSFAKN